MSAGSSLTAWRRSGWVGRSSVYRHPKSGLAMQETPELVDLEGEAIAELMRFRRRPARLADELTRKAYRDYSKRNVGPKVAWVPAAQRKSQCGSR